jgi:hypothetical protein
LIKEMRTLHAGKLPFAAIRKGRGRINGSLEPKSAMAPQKLFFGPPKTRAADQGNPEPSDNTCGSGFSRDALALNPQERRG